MTAHRPAPVALALAALLLACSSTDGARSGAAGSGGAEGSGASDESAHDGSTASDGAKDGAAELDGATAAPSSEDGVCGRVTRSAMLSPAYLAFVFDVSGSMGEGDEPWHDKTLKWDPVLAATQSFLTDPGSRGVSAAMTLFPARASETVRCDDETYTHFDMPMTELPSAAFAAFLDEHTPRSADAWGDGTPTRAAVRGVLEAVRDHRSAHPGSHALVLVTDGYPTGCGEDADRIDAVGDALADARNDDVPTFVIGVENPPLPGAPNTLTDLHAIARAGGTERAYLIDTGSPSATADAFLRAVGEIRASSVPCDVAIPSFDGFQPENVLVEVRRGDRVEGVPYRTACEDSPGFHYDDPVSPRTLVLCDATCSALRGDAEAELSVTFTCEPQILL